MTTLADINQTLIVQNEMQEKTTKAVDSLTKRFAAFLRVAKGDKLEDLESRREARRQSKAMGFAGRAKGAASTIKNNIGLISKILGGLALAAFVLQNDEIREAIANFIEAAGGAIKSVFQSEEFREILGSVFKAGADAFVGILGAVWDTPEGKLFIGGLTTALIAVIAGKAFLTALTTRMILGGMLPRRPGGAPGPVVPGPNTNTPKKGLFSFLRRIPKPGYLTAALGGFTIGSTLMNDNMTADEKAVSVSGAGGGMAGAAGGAYAGGALGAFGGPLAPVTVPLGALIGSGIGYFGGEFAGKGLANLAVGEDGFLQAFKKRATQFENFLQSQKDKPIGFENAAPLPFGLDAIDVPSVNLDKTLGLGEYKSDTTNQKREALINLDKMFGLGEYKDLTEEETEQLKTLNDNLETLNKAISNPQPNFYLDRIIRMGAADGRHYIPPSESSMEYAELMRQHLMFQEARSMGMSGNVQSKIPALEQAMDGAGTGQPIIVPVPIPMDAGKGPGPVVSQGTVGGNLSAGETIHLNQDPATIIGGMPRQQSE